MPPITQYSISEVQDAHQALLMAEQHRLAGEPDRARDVYEQLLEQNPDYAAALFSLGQSNIESRDYAAALPHLVRAAMANPMDGSTHANLGRVYLELDADECAVRCAERALSLNAQSPIAYYIIGVASLKQSDYSGAVEAFEKARVQDPEDASTAVMIGNCYVLLERFSDATEILTVALQMPLTREQRALACYIISQHRQVLEGVDLLEEIDKFGDTRPDDSEITANNLAFAKAAVLDQHGRHQEAWRCLLDANRQVYENIAQQRETYVLDNQRLLEKAVNWNKPKADSAESEDTDTPISLFILGPSHSGKSALESLIAPMEGIAVGYDNKIFANTARRISQRAGLLTQDWLANLPGELNDSFTKLYHSKLRNAAGDARVVTISHPGAISDAGRLSQCIPNARFVFMKRDEDDTALRTFSQLYSPNVNPYAYDVADIYQHISQYYRMTGNWLEKLGNQAITVQYEDIVDDPKSTLIHIAEICGLKPPSKLNCKVGDDRGCAEPYAKWLHAAKDAAKAP